MPEFDLHNKTKIVQAVSPVAITATTTAGTGIDTIGFDSIEWVLVTGSATMDGAFTLALQQSDDDGSGDAYAAVPTAEVLGALPDIAIGEVNSVRRVGSIGKKRWQRVVVTEASANTTGVIGVIGVLGYPHTVPTDAQAT